MTGSNILIIDDDEDIRRALAILLRSKGYHTSCAVDGLSAMTAIRSETPDLVLLDLMLPAGDGYALLDRLRDIPRLASLPVIVVSACDASRHAQRSISAGACAYLQKPIRSDELLATIERYLRPAPAGGGGASREPSKPATGSRKRVLVVDDDADLRSALFVRLREDGYQMHFAGDAVAAIQAARQQLPHVILLDIGLPAGDGFLVIERLRASADLTSIPIIVITGREAQDLRSRSLAAGAVAFLTKPVDVYDLRDAIRSALQRSPARV